MNRTAYLAGEVTGLSQGQGIEKFNMMASKLSDMGYSVVKPQAVNDDTAAGDASVRNDIKKMLECDEVHMLPDWQNSREAQLERDIALRLGMEVVYH